jgi:protein Mpv17
MIPSAGAWVRSSPRRILRNSLRTHIVRRQHASKPPGVPTGLAPEQTIPGQTIPGPTWLWLEPIYGPFRAYGRVQQRRPYLTQFVSSLVIYFAGDMVAQSITKPAPKAERLLEEPATGNKDNDGDEDNEKGWVQQWSDDRDWARTLRALVIGGVSSIPSYRWFLWLGNSFNYSSKILSLTTKVVVNQICFTPVFNTYFFGMQTFLAGASISEILERIRHTVPTSCINSCKLWPAVTAFSFTYIPIQYRSIFGGVIAIGWQTYLNLLNQRAAALEEAEHHHPSVENVTIKAIERRVECSEEKQKCAA